jgi:hypothetical protein
MMQSWVGPAIVAAVISALITAIGWFVTYRTSLGIEKERRREKIRDFQIALRAEIRSELHNLNDENLGAELDAIEKQYSASGSYSVFVPGLVRHDVFNNLIKELHILPERVIDPLILYSRQRQALDGFAQDMRSERFTKVSQARQLEMYRDYVAVTRYLRTLATEAVAAIDAALAEGNIQ